MSSEGPRAMTRFPVELGEHISVLVLPSATPEERSERGRNDQTVAARVPPRSVLVLPSATPEERSERGRNDQTVAARVPPRYAFGDRGHTLKRIKLTVFPATLFSLAYFTLTKTWRGKQSP
ncbi:hypothetical protein NDU88_009783 [Pleurodeles waltl]|uniref:Uncharacterized protein n=1 Tax=Pleurodeles waltl TaxID=8319 RepID=A0AAV7S207_PLEWA|nr:hypothetical protein NDU88_009783 [Pleurodeles waltl]